MRTTSTAEVTGNHNTGEQQWWLTDNSTILVGEYAVQRPTGSDPTIDAFDNNDVLKTGADGEELWQTIGKSAAMPSGMMSLLLSITYKLDYELTSDCILINTVISLITLPLIIMII